DWVEIVEPRSREHMYVNLTTGECGWDPPTGVPVRQTDGNQWWELFDHQSGRFYYYNSTERRTVWHRPQGADIVPLSQLQAMRRCRDIKRAGKAVDKPHHGTTGSISSTGSQGQTLETSEEDAVPELDPAVDGRLQGEGSSTEQTTDGGKDSPRCPAASRKGYFRVLLAYRSEGVFLFHRSASQRWQPTPGSKAAMLVKASNNKNPGAQLGSGQAYKTAPPGRMTADPRQAHHLRKASNGSFCLVPSDGSHPSPLLHRSQTSTPCPVSPHYGSTAPIYDEPVSDYPIYDEPPTDMEVEGAHMCNGPPLSRSTPTHSLQKPRLLQHPGPSHPGSRHRRNPSASDYSPAGLECIKHMINVDPKQGHLSCSPLPTRAPSPTPRKDTVSPQPHPQPHSHSLPQGRAQVRDKEPATPGPNTLDKKQSWRVLEATVQRAMEARHSRQSSQASQDFPSSATQATANYQDSGYSTGPSPSLRRKMQETGGSRRRRRRQAGVGGQQRRAVRSQREADGWYGGGGEGSTGRCASREDVVPPSPSIPGNQSNPGLSPLEVPGRQKRTYEKVDTLDMSITSQASLSSPETPGPPSQTWRGSGWEDREAGSGSRLSKPLKSALLSYATLRQPPPPSTGMEDWASKHLNLHTQGLFRRRVSIANMLSWNRGSIKKPMLVTSNRVVRKEACEMFKLVQAYMGDRPSRLDRRHCALLIVTKCWDLPGLRDELYVQLVRQTTGNASPRSLAAGWELMAVSLAFFAPSPKFRCYLEGYIQRHTEPASDKKRLPVSTYAKFCHRKLQKVAITGGKKGLRKPTLEEIDHSRRAIVTPSLFGSSLEEVMERQSELFPDRKLPWVQVQLSQYVLGLGGAQTEGIFRVPGDIDEVNALKLQVDQWRIPENLSDPNVPASLMKLWYRELEEPLIPMDFYKQCVSNCDDPVAAITVVQALPELNRLVLCYFINFLQVFAQPSNVAVTKMDVNNLAMVMAPNCLRCQSDDPRIIFENTRKEMAFLRMLIVHLDTSFIEGVV
uniref:Rho GTPase-activating protein 39 n=1 Tax=Tetraodon nigroviridis TaxID=99883 RepID=H3C2H1_TETNG